MKRLEEIKEEFAISQQFDTWKRLKYFYKDDQCAFEKVLCDISQLYAREVAQASLEKAAENVALFKEFSEFEFKHWIDKESITNEYNITLL